MNRRICGGIACKSDNIQDLPINVLNAISINASCLPQLLSINMARLYCCLIALLDAIQCSF